jgi:hypothetical protein
MGGQRPLVGLVAIVGAVLALAACGATESPEPREVGEVESALRDAGLRICTSPDAGDPPEGAEAEEAFTVGITCGDDDDLATVSLIAWPDSEARDNALRRFEVRTRPPTRNHGITWALGQFTVSVSGERDDAVVERVADAMDRLGAA